MLSQGWTREMMPGLQESLETSLLGDQGQRSAELIKAARQSYVARTDLQDSAAETDPRFAGAVPYNPD